MVLAKTWSFVAFAKSTDIKEAASPPQKSESNCISFHPASIERITPFHYQQQSCQPNVCCHRLCQPRQRCTYDSILLPSQPARERSRGSYRANQSWPGRRQFIGSGKIRPIVELCRSCLIGNQPRSKVRSTMCMVTTSTTFFWARATLAVSERPVELARSSSIRQVIVSPDFISRDSNFLFSRKR